ncbi:MAG: TetR/AcrR family transcriptional regulator [Ancalomicrobiaceae bacterium]|nr:TetR/AcrR family transcriptional regulator [Ancalomicrobiaceae bacterium]
MTAIDECASRDVTIPNHRAPGRPRDEAAGRTILDVTRRLVGELGYDAVTTRMIADAAGTGKQTIYRRWPSKPELVLAAFLAHAEETVDQPIPEATPARERIALFVERTFSSLMHTAPAVRGLMAMAQHDGDFRRIFRTNFVEPRRLAFAQLLEGAIADGLFPSDHDLEAMSTALFGAIWLRLLLDERLDAEFAGRLTAIVVDGIRGN